MTQGASADASAKNAGNGPSDLLVAYDLDPQISLDASSSVEMSAVILDSAEPELEPEWPALELYDARLIVRPPRPGATPSDDHRPRNDPGRRNDCGVGARGAGMYVSMVAFSIGLS